MKLLEYIRSRDSATKARVSLSIALGVTSVIGLLWVSTFKARVTPISLDTREVEEVEQKYTDSRSLGDIIGDAKSQLGALMNAGKKSDKVEEKEIHMGDTVGTTTTMGADSALKTLTVPQKHAVEQAGTTSQSVTPMSEKDIFSSTPVTTEDQNKAESIEPRVILIGTTTSQGVE